MLGMLSGFSVLASEMPRSTAVPLALAALAHATWLARRQWRLPPRKLVLPEGDGIATLDGEAMASVSVVWRGPLAFLRWRDPKGRLQRMSAWPDTLDRRGRRELRLAMVARRPAPPARSMAP
ncbi:hypothetical protein [Montanilutibacter psychrotolerans]|nr:hypothetical protein [Lysobacter psychrotolerans]